MRSSRHLFVALALLLISRPASAAIIGSLTDNFNGTSVDASKWSSTNRGLENNAPAGYNAPSESGGTLTLGGTTNNHYWFGNSLESVNSFASNLATTVQVERVSLAGTGSAWRSSEWIYGDGGNFIHFSQNVGEDSWQFNCNGCGGAAAATGGGTAIGQFNASQNDGGDHVMKMVFTPGLGSDVKISLFLDNTAGPVVDFSNWTPASFTTILTGQARSDGDTVSAVFDNFSAVAVPEPSSLVLAGLSVVGLFVAARRRRKV